MFAVRAESFRPDLFWGVPVLRCLLIILFLAGCSAAPPAEPEPEARFTTTDVAWMQLTDALHARALPVLELAPERAGRPVADLSVRLRTTHEAGRGRLRALLATAGITGDNPHTQMDMPGMPTAAEVKKLTKLKGESFDRRFSGLMKAYLDQLVLVANGERSSGGAAEVRDLAAAMVREHGEELAELDRISA